MTPVTVHGTRPPGWILIVMVVIVCVGLLCLFGCVSIPTHEKMKIERYSAGVNDGVKLSLRVLKNQGTVAKTERALKEILGLTDSRRKK